MDAFDHFIKDELRIRQYIRYTDDAVIVHQHPEALRYLLTRIEAWLSEHRRLVLHPRKVEIRKLRQGIDFLGYVVRPYHVVLRTKTKRRMFRRVDAKNRTSYLGLLVHCSGWKLRKRVARYVSEQ